MGCSMNDAEQTGTDASGITEEPTAESPSCSAELDEQKRSFAELNDRFLRMVADFENFKKRKAQYMAKDKSGRDVFLADSGYVLQMAQNDFKNIKFHFTSEF